MTHRLTDDTILNDQGVLLYRVQATRDLAAHGVRAGDVGGWVDSPHRLRDSGWVADDAQVFDSATISGTALASGNAQVFESASLNDSAHIRDHAKAHGCAQLCENSIVSGHATIGGSTFVLGDSHIGGSVHIDCGAWIEGARISGPADFLYVAPLLGVSDGVCGVFAARTQDGTFCVSVGDWCGTLDEFAAAHPGDIGGEAALFAALLQRRLGDASRRRI